MNAEQYEDFRRLFSQQLHHIVRRFIDQGIPVEREEVVAAAFRIHPYHHDTIGDMCDLETISRDELWRHYQSHYVPNNAVTVLVGDVDVDLDAPLSLEDE